MNARVSERRKYAEKLLEAAQAKANSATLVFVPWVVALLAFWWASFEPLISTLREAEVALLKVDSFKKWKNDFRGKLNDKRLPDASRDILKERLITTTAGFDDRKSALRKLKDEVTDIP